MVRLSPSGSLCFGDGANSARHQFPRWLLWLFILMITARFNSFQGVDCLQSCATTGRKSFLRPLLPKTNQRWMLLKPESEPMMFLQNNKEEPVPKDERWMVLQPDSEATMALQNDKEGLITLQSDSYPNTLVAEEIPTILKDHEKQKIIMLGLLWSIAFLSALDRVAMSVALLPISQEMGYNDATKGAISSLFSVGYGLMILPAGILIGTASPRVVMASGIFLWSLGTATTPFSTGLESMLPLLAVRACVGAAESVVVPTIQRLLSAWTSANEKGQSLAIIFSGFQSGTIAAYLLSPLIIDSMGGWRGLFYTYGFVGFLTLVPWLLLAQDSPEIVPIASDSATTPEFTKNALQEWTSGFKKAPWKNFFQSKGVWAMILAHSAKNWLLYVTLAWTPTFYAEQYGMSVKESAWLSVLPSIASMACGFLAGKAADTILCNMKDIDDDKITNLRKFFQGIALYGPAVALGSLAWHIPETPWVSQAYLMAAVGLQAFTAAGYESGNQEKAGERYAGLLYGITSLPAVIVGTAGTYVTGQVLDYTNQDWSIVFNLISFVSFFGATAFVTLYDSKREFE